MALLVCLLGCGKTDRIDEPSIAASETNLARSESFYKLENEFKLRTFMDKRRVPSDTVMFVPDTVVIMTDSGLSVSVRRIQRSPSNQFFGLSNDSIRILYQRENERFYGFSPPAYYGEDSRKEFYLEKKPARRKNGERVVSLFKKEKVKDADDGFASIKTNQFDRYEDIRVCDLEKFYGQQQGAYCTGFAISDRLIVTAKHCMEGVNDSNIADMVRFVFGFQYIDVNNVPTKFPGDRVYKGKKIVAVSKEYDIAIIEIEGRLPTFSEEVTFAEKVADFEQDIYVLGHPLGLPLKVAGEAVVFNNENREYFVTSLDTYGGNSGSPVFNSRDQFLGILVRGAKDMQYSYRYRCYSSNYCPKIGPRDCEGEHVSRALGFMTLIRK